MSDFDYYEEQKKSGLKKGDKVKIIKTKLAEEEWFFTHSMTRAIGEIRVIRTISRRGVILDNGYSFPYYSLVKIPED